MDQDATWYTEVGLGPGHIVLDGDPAASKGGKAPTFRPMFIVAKRLDGSRCLGANVGLGPSNIVSDADPSPHPRGRAPIFLPMSVVAKRLDGSRCHVV